MRDKQGFAEFAAARGGALRRLALLLTGDPERAARLADQALAEVSRRWRRYAASGGAAAAEAHVRRLLAVGAIRRHPAIPASAEGSGDSELVWRGLASLPPRRRVVLVLRFDEGLDDAAIGERLGLPPDAAAAEREAGMAALRSILLRRGRPEDLLPAALAAVPAPVGTGGRRRPRRRRLVVAGAGAAALAAGAALLVPALGGSVEANPLPATGAAPGGGLAWPTRGPLAGDPDLLRAALRAWRDGVPPAQRPVDPAVLYAGSPDGTRVVLLQGADADGLGWVAEVTDTGGALGLRRLQPLGRAVPLLALSTVFDGGPVRLLAPPDATGGLLARDPGLAPDAPLRRLDLDADGLSESLWPGAAGVPVVVVTGGTATSSGPAVAGSGLVVAGGLSVLTGTVEIGAGSLPLAGSTDVRAVWYDDGALLAGRLGGPVVVAAAGPVLATSVRTVRPAARPRRLEARTYEARRAGTRFLATVLRVDGAPACVETLQLGPVGAPATLPVVVRRCLPVRARDGAVLVVAGEQVVEVRLRLPAARAGQPRPRPVTLRRPADQPAGTAFVTLARIADLAARGGSGEAYDAAGRVVARITLGSSSRPRG
jgi:DNA-directed RNA polymerase specialized sigma24 family protein